VEQSPIRSQVEVVVFGGYISDSLQTSNKRSARLNQDFPDVSRPQSGRLASFLRKPAALACIAPAQRLK
jgi:hypothetical protein